MMKKWLFLAVIPFSLLLSSCSQDPAAQLGKTMNKYADIIIEADDCSKCAQELNAFIDKESENIADNLKKLMAQDPQKIDQEKLKKSLDFPEDKKTKMETAKCYGDPDVSSAQLKFGMILLGAMMNAATESGALDNINVNK